MGQHADDIINGDVDQHTGEWLGDGQGYPRSNSELESDNNPNKYTKGTKAIRKELAILIKGCIKDAKKNNPTKKENTIVEECRQSINVKYGKGWREQF